MLKYSLSLISLFALFMTAIALAAEQVEQPKTLPKGELFENREVKLNKEQCQSTVIARGSFDGVYEGEECGDGCSAVFRLVSGEQLYLACGDADKFYAPSGRRVVAYFEVGRSWQEYKEQGWRACMEEAFCVKPPVESSSVEKFAVSSNEEPIPTEHTKVELSESDCQHKLIREGVF